MEDVANIVVCENVKILLFGVFVVFRWYDLLFDLYLLRLMMIVCVFVGI